MSRRLHALDVHRLGERPCVSPIGCKNSSVSISPTVAGLRLVVSMFASPLSVALVIQINAVSLTAQLLKATAGRHTQVLIGRGIIEHLAPLYLQN